MRKSREVPLTLLVALALSSTACNRQSETRNCVDAQNRIVPEADCHSPSSGGGCFHYVYGGASGGRVGDTVERGSTSSGGEEEGVERGGFGHGEGGEGGGE